jgi:glycosyltransferase involved in cell wall biosynthesis
MFDTIKIVMYSSCSLFNGKSPSGGTKRFVELLEFLGQHMPKSELYSPDEKTNVAKYGIRFVKIYNPSKKIPLLSPEVNLFFANIESIKRLKKECYHNLIIFDVPPAVGPLLYGVKHVTLMVRKDMIGYEKVQNKKKTKWIKILFQWVCESICMLKAEQIVTQCNFDKNVLKRRHPLLANRIEEKTIVQINNVNPSWIIEKSKKKEIGLPQLFDESKFKICFIGGFDNPRKGQDLLLASACEILKRSSDVQFIFIGGGQNLDNYRQRYESNDIVFLGRQDNPLPILKACNLLVVPSYADSCPNTVMEALYNEIPVIGSLAGGIPEILIDGNSLFELDKTSLTKSIIYLKDNPDALSNLKKFQKQRKEQLIFDWPYQIVKRIVEV